MALTISSKKINALLVMIILFSLSNVKIYFGYLLTQVRHGFKHVLKVTCFHTL